MDKEEEKANRWEEEDFDEILEDEETLDSLDQNKEVPKNNSTSLDVQEETTEYKGGLFINSLAQFFPVAQQAEIIEEPEFDDG